MRSKSRQGPRIFAVLIALLTAATLGMSWKSPFSRAVQAGEPVFGLLIGTDLVDYARHADTIIVAKYDPKSRGLDLLSIPRDTKIDLPGVKVKRINEVYTYAFKASKKNHAAASEELSKAVQWLLLNGSTEAAGPGFMSGAFYAQVDYEGFKKMIDLLGGVPVTVDEPMHYDDNWGNLHIHFEPGKYRLDGQKALEFVRFRGLSGDAGRVSRQQEFLMNIFNCFKSPFNLAKLPGIAWISVSSVRTNLGWYERLHLLWEMKDLTREDIRLLQLPGKAQRGFWLPDPGGVAATTALLAGERPVRPAVRAPVEPAPDSSEGGLKTAPPAAAPPATVEVWNASGRKGLALEVVHKLRNAGFDVVKWGNYSSMQQRTLVRDHTGRTESARAIVEALGSKTEVFTRAEADPLVDVEVILGEDYGKE